MPYFTAEQPAAASPASLASDKTTTKPSQGLNSFTFLQNSRWLYERPEEGVYKLIIGTYRLRMAD